MSHLYTVKSTDMSTHWHTNSSKYCRICFNNSR